MCEYNHKDSCNIWPPVHPCMSHPAYDVSAGDHADKDLELALQHIHAAGRRGPVVVSGQMHEKLRGTLNQRNIVHASAEVKGHTSFLRRRLRRQSSGAGAAAHPCSEQEGPVGGVRPHA